MRYQPFDLGCCMAIEGSEQAQKMQANVAFILGLSPESLLRSFRVNAKLDPEGAAPLTGWEAPNHAFRGHFVGHYLSALAKSYAMYQVCNLPLAAQFLY